jgi:hypothetical protein
MSAAQTPLPAVTIAPDHTGNFAVRIGTGWPSRFADPHKAREHARELAETRDLPLIDLSDRPELD